MATVVRHFVEKVTVKTSVTQAFEMLSLSATFGTICGACGIISRIQATVACGEAIMRSAPPRRYTPEEYLELERAAEFKSEYLDGQIYAMSGGSLAHAAITFKRLAVQSGEGPGEPPSGFFD